MTMRKVVGVYRKSRSYWVGLLGTAIITAAIGLFLGVAMPRWYGDPHIKIHGRVASKYREVAEIFQQNFLSGLDREGAHLVVYERGRAVVDLWAGYSDRQTTKSWRHNTQSILFSISKSISALCIAKLVDDGHLEWSDRVTKFWPEFGQNGKENTTIDHVLTHQSGLPYIESPITILDVLNRTTLHTKLAAAHPVWVPGSATGYHAVTQGFLIDAIIERVDLQRRSLQRYFHEEFAQVYDLDISFGQPNEESEFSSTKRNRLVRFALPDWWEWARYVLFEPRIVLAYLMMEMQPSDAPLHRLKRNPDWIHMDDAASAFFNDARIRRLSIGSLTGVATARDLARLFSLVLDGRVFRRPATLDALLQPLIHDWHWERVVLYPVMKGRGFFYEYHPRETNKFTFGHPGYGCQTLHLDAERDTVMVYLSNTIKPASSVICTPYQRLLRAVYRALYNNKDENNVNQNDRSP